MKQSDRVFREKIAALISPRSLLSRDQMRDAIREALDDELPEDETLHVDGCSLPGGHAGPCDV
jgi:hypothetical protein